MSTSEKTLPLWAEPAGIPPAVAPAANRPTAIERGDAPRPGTRLWLCLLLPELPLEVAGQTGRDEPLAVVEERQGRLCLVAVNEAAARANLMPGLDLSAAYARLPGLAALTRRPWLEQQALERLARCCARYTPSVSLEPPAGVLVEVAASLRLFGGLHGIAGRLAEEVQTLGHRVHLECAPTPLAALWLARAGMCDPHRPDTLEWPIEAGRLAGRLGELPVECLGWPEEAMSLLDQLGLRRLRDCLRLPRDGFARRFGAVRLDEFDRALGRRPDPRVIYEPPQRHAARFDLPQEIEDSARLLEAARQLLQPLGRALYRSQRGVAQLRLICHHRSGPDTLLIIGLLEPSGDPRHLLALLAERFERLVLPAPVCALSLQTAELLPVEAASETLFAELPCSRNPLPRLIERLRARLGITAVHGLRQVAEHRPERAWRTCEPLQAGGPAPAAAAGPQDCVRPLWIFVEPLPLGERASLPCYGGLLRLEEGPERIETGWWDGAEVGRDYYIACSMGGRRLWVYREHRPPHRWFAHGAFG